MPTTESYGVMVLKFEFWLSVILFLGGGALIWNDKTLITPIFTLWGILITFWFKSREAEKTSSNLITALQQQPPLQTRGADIAPADTAPATIYNQMTPEDRQQIRDKMKGETNYV